ncbi:MAG: hypothetical protein K8I27_08390 [Planctomycetes bacterium]|nr:hypothetical protein [Planctomycetota bacterium]
MPYRVAIAAAFLLVLVLTSTAQDQEPAPDFKLRKIADTKPQRQTWRGRDVIRNGGFDYGNSAWAMNGGIAGVGTDSGRAGDDKDYGAAIQVNNTFGTTGFLCQMLHLPDKLTDGTLKLDWRLVSKGEGANLQGLTVAIGSFDEHSQFESAATIKEVNAANFPGWEWQQIDHKLGEAELKAINTRRSQRPQLVLIASINGDLLQLDVDKVSLTVDGEFTPPEAPTFIAYGETTRVKGPDGGRDQFEINAASADGSKRVSMFRHESLSVENYGLAWRHDGNELCFSSTHEMAHSYFSADLYALDEKGVRRVTNPPGRDELLRDDRKTGSVKLKVRNLTFENVQGGIYIDGARKLGFFSLGPAETASEETELLIDDVVDFGDAVLQTIIVRVGGKSAISGATVDVLAGETADGGVATVDLTLQHVNASSPSYSKDGKSITFATGSLFSVAAAGGVPGSDDYGSLVGSDPNLSPADNTLVYTSYTGGLWTLKPGADKATELLSGDKMLFSEDACWFPDASGILFTGMTSNPAGWGGRNVCAIVMENKQLVQLTDLFNENVEDPTISPDGKWIAGIRTMASNGNTHRELWVWKVGEPQTCWQIETKGQPSHPAWSPK